MRSSLLALLTISLLASVPAGAATIDVTSCPATVPVNTVGVLQDDLDCEAGPTSSITLERGATLDLNGHTIAFQPVSGSLGTIVRCDSRCTVQGPGALVSSSGPPLAFAAIWVAERGRATIRDVAISGAGSGVVALNGIVRISNSTIEAVHWGVATVSRALVENVSIDVAQPGGYCLGATDETGSIVKGSDVILTGCPDGIWASRQVKLDRLTAVGLGRIAVFSRNSIRLRDSTVTGSGSLDLLSGRRPKLTNTACDRSGVDVDDVPSESWGVCAND
jgi:hypothetical protein